MSKFSYGQFGIVRASESQRESRACSTDDREAERSYGASYRAQTITCHRRAARSDKTSTSGEAPHRGLAHFLHRWNGRRHHAQWPSLQRRKRSCSSPSIGARKRRHDVHNDDQRVSYTTDTSDARPYDTYIADLTEVLVQKKHLQQPTSEWVLCLADLSLALPLDRTVASLEGQTDLTLVRRQWASEHGLRGDMRGGDPSASIFKRTSEPIPLGFGRAAGDFSQTYKVCQSITFADSRNSQSCARRQSGGTSDN